MAIFLRLSRRKKSRERKKSKNLSSNVNCLGDGHDGVWNIVEKIGTIEQRRELLDWYHLMENLHKVGGSNQRLRQAKNYLWYGLVDEAIREFDNLSKKNSEIFSYRIFHNMSYIKLWKKLKFKILLV